MVKQMAVSREEAGGQEGATPHDRETNDTKRGQEGAEASGMWRAVTNST